MFKKLQKQAANFNTIFQQKTNNSAQNPELRAYVSGPKARTIQFERLRTDRTKYLFQFQ